MSCPHLGFSEESESSWIVPVLFIHIEAGAIQLILYYDQRLIERNQFIVLINEHVFIG